MVGSDNRIDRRTIRRKHHAMAKTKETDIVHKMICHSQKVGIPFDYVFFDTWFSNPSQLTVLKKNRADVIAMIKKNSTKYTWTDPNTRECQKLNVNEIYSRNKKRSKRKYWAVLCALTWNLTRGDPLGVYNALVNRNIL